MLLSATAFASQKLQSYAVSYAKAHLINSLQDGIQVGSLRITEGKEVRCFGNFPSEKPSAEINVVNDSFWLQVFVGYDLGFSEAYMFGDFETPDLKAVFDVWISNRDRLGSLLTFVGRLVSASSALVIRYFGQSLSQARYHCITGYDCCNEFFESFLSEEMTYSSAIWPERVGGVRGDIEHGPVPGDLETAQLEKIHLVLRKARVRPGDRLLEFGSGWGAMAIEAAKLGCTVDSLTLSVEQKQMAEKRIKAAGLESRITIHLLDYRLLPADFQHAFDAFVSVEMVEAIGLQHLNRFFKILDWALKPDRATAVVTITTQPEWRYSTFQAAEYSRRYQWPNSFLPSATAFISIAQDAVKGRFILASAEDYGYHYPRTLREWSRRFERNWNDKTISALLKHQSDLAKGKNLDIFKRKWQFMFVYAEVGYARAYTSMHYFTFARPENILTACD